MPVAVLVSQHSCSPTPFEKQDHSSVLASAPILWHVVPLWWLVWWVLITILIKAPFSWKIPAIRRIRQMRRRLWCHPVLGWKLCRDFQLVTFICSYSTASYIEGFLLSYRYYFPDVLSACSVRRQHFTVLCDGERNGKRGRYIDKEFLSNGWFNLHLEKYQEQSYSRQNCS